jgi:hypothetical protein
MNVRCTIASLSLALFPCAAGLPGAHAAVRPDPTAVESVRSPDPGCPSCRPDSARVPPDPINPPWRVMLNPINHPGAMRNPQTPPWRSRRLLPR